MRICLISNVNLATWYNREDEPAMRSLPLGLLSLAAVLEQGGHQVSILDLNYALTKGELALDDDLIQVAADRVVERAPQLVGFSTMCNGYHIALRQAQAVKSVLPHVPILLGGPQASVVDAETLTAFPFVDMVLRGEAEQTLPLLVSALAQRRVLDDIPGLTYRSGDAIIRNPDAPLLANLDALPVPLYGSFPYGPGDTPALDVGRGCPFACSFCSTSTFWRRKFRLKSIDRILQEMGMLERDYGATSFTFMHDLFTVNRQRMHTFCNRLQTDQPNVTWTCSARNDCVDASLLKHMADAGCRGVFYGVESGSPSMQREIGKNLKLDQVLATVEATRGANLVATVSFIAGFPKETEGDVRLTMDLIQNLIHYPEVHVQLHLLAPQVGTLDYRRYSDRLRFDGYYSDITGAADKFLDPDWFRQYPDLFSSFYYYETEHLSRDQLRGLDLFVHGPCAASRGTVLHLLEGGRTLWGLYHDWRIWSATQHRGAGPMGGQSLDEYLLDFYEFASAEVAAGRSDFDLGHARDEVLTFYLEHYGDVPVHFVSPDTESAQAAETRGGEECHLRPLG